MAEFCYGYAFSMPSTYMPSGYSAGLMGQAPDKLVWDANSWSRGACAEASTKLRNVFPLNFVNKSHLGQKLQSEGLGTWIESDRSRGVLSEWYANLFLWSFPDTPENQQASQLDLTWDNPRVASVRELLEKLSFFPWQAFVAKFS